MTTTKQQQWFLSHVLLLVLLGIYCFCGIATAIPISDEGNDDNDDHYGVGGSRPLFAAKVVGGENALQIASRRDDDGGRREEQGKDLSSAAVVVMGKRDKNWGRGGLDGNGNGNGNKGGGFALNNNGPVFVGGDGSGSLVGKVGDGHPLELASLSSSSSSSSLGGTYSSVSSTSSGDTLVKQQEESEIDPSALKEIVSNRPSNSQASLAAWEARLNAREQQQNLRDQKQDAMAVTLGNIRDTLNKQVENFQKLLDDKIQEEALPLGCTCRNYQPDIDWGGI